MVSIYLSVRLDSEYLEFLSERYHREFNYETFDWCRLENPKTGMKLPAREELDATVEYLSFFLEDLRETLSSEELGRINYLESSLERWRSNAHLLYSRALEFITAAIALYYEIPRYIINQGNGNASYLKILFEDLESILLELLDSGENKLLMAQLLKTMELTIDEFNALELHMDASAAKQIQNLQEVADLFAVESLLSSRL